MTHQIKVAGVSAVRLQKLIDSAKKSIADSTTQPYDGAWWTAQWEVTEGEASTYNGKPTVDVTEARFLSARGGSDEDEGELDPLWNERFTPDQALAVGKAIAKAVSGSWSTEAFFAYVRGSEHAWYAGVKKVGDELESEGDSFAGVVLGSGDDGRGGDWRDTVVVKSPVTLKVRASFSKRDNALRFKATFSATA